MKRARVPWLAASMAVVLLAWIGVRLAQPIGDADVFWHMAYARQMLARHSLRVDHTIYSWMPASNAMIYCAWLSELLLLGLWNAMGLAGLAVLRYGAFLLSAAPMAYFAYRLGKLGQPLTWLLILFASLAGSAVSQPKPELLSLVLWSALLCCYFLFRATGEEGWIWAVPALMLVWVNVHGGFILAGPFLAVTLIAEWLRPGSKVRTKMTLAWAAALIALAANPYGSRYPLQLARDYLFQGTARPDVEWNSAHQSAFSHTGFEMHLPEFLAIMAITWLIFGRGKWLILTLNLVYLPLYVVYLRSSFLLPVLFAYGAIWMVNLRRRAWLDFAIAAVFLFWVGRSFYEMRVRPSQYSWTGFGYSFFLPVEETDFVARANMGPRLYNLFDSGGYLLWRLYPQYLVMTDSRSFPYLSWFDELYRFTRDSTPEQFEAFLARHPANIALIDLKEQQVWRNFLKTPGWYPAFYGPSAVVFERGRSAGAPGVADGVGRLRNADAAFHVFSFAETIGDFRTAWTALDQLNGPLRRSADPARLNADLEYRQAHAALRSGDYGAAEQRFLSALEGTTIGDRDALVLTLLRSLREAAGMNPRPDVDRIVEALHELAAP